MKSKDNHLARLADPALRGYVIATAAAIAIIFAVQFDAGTVAAAGVPALCGIAGLLLRWTAMPVALVVTLAYFLIFPIGLPFGLAANSILRESHFRLDDIILAGAVLVYLVAQYRIFELTPAKKSGTREVEPFELTRSLGTLAVIVGVGQVLWFLIANLEPHFGAQSPLRWKPAAQSLFRGTAAPSSQSAELSRFLMLALVCVLVAAVVRMAFWYLRLMRLTPLEARLVLVDTHWQENRRELARLETWRSYRLGHDGPRGNARSAAFRWIVRGIVLAILAVSLVWILYIYLNIP